MIDLDTTTKKYLRVDEMMELFDVSRRTVYYWATAGKIPHINLGGGGIRFSVTIVRALVKIRADYDVTTPRTRQKSTSVQSVTH